MSTESRTDKTKSISNVQKEDNPDLQRFADENGVVLLAFIGSYVPRRYGPAIFVDSMITARDEIGVEQALAHIMKKCPSKKRKLYLLVNSPGGRVSSAFKIAMAIRKSFADITVQVWHEGHRISVNSILAAETIVSKRIAMRSDDELSYLEKQLAESFDPAILVESHNTIKMGLTYLSQILTAAGYDNECQDSIIQNLIFDLPTHGFVIQADWAKQIGVNVQSSDTGLEEWNMMQKWLLDYIEQAEDRHFIRYVIPEKGKEK